MQQGQTRIALLSRARSRLDRSHAWCCAPRDRGVVQGVCVRVPCKRLLQEADPEGLRVRKATCRKWGKVGKRVQNGAQGISTRQGPERGRGMGAFQARETGGRRSVWKQGSPFFRGDSWGWGRGCPDLGSERVGKPSSPGRRPRVVQSCAGNANSRLPGCGGGGHAGAPVRAVSHICGTPPPPTSCGERPGGEPGRNLPLAILRVRLRLGQRTPAGAARHKSSHAAALGTPPPLLKPLWLQSPFWHRATSWASCAQPWRWHWGVPVPLPGLRPRSQSEQSEWGLAQPCLQCQAADERDATSEWRASEHVQSTRTVTSANRIVLKRRSPANFSPVHALKYCM